MATKPTPQEIQDIRDAAKAEAAYNKAMPNPDTSFNLLKAEKKEEPKAAPKKYSHGGRIDGCAVKGKTRGRTV